MVSCTETHFYGNVLDLVVNDLGLRGVGFSTRDTKGTFLGRNSPFPGFRRKTTMFVFDVDFRSDCGNDRQISLTVLTFGKIL